MKSLQAVIRPTLVACLAILVSLNAAIAQPAKEYAPTLGQPGKDVMWLPSPL